MDLLEKDEQAQAAFDRGQAFAVAAYLVEPHLAAIQPLVRKTLAVRRVLAGDFPAKAYLFPKTFLDGRAAKDVLFGTDGDPGILLSRLEDVNAVPATLKGCTLPFICGREAKTELIYSHEKEMEEEEKIKHSNAANCLHRLAQRFSCVTGMRVKFHADGHGTRSPKPEEPGTIHLMTGSHPPGEHEGQQARTHLFGIQLHPKLYYLNLQSGTKGRGMLLKQTDGLTETAFVQILGTNIYFLFPILSYYWDPNTGLMFCKALGKAYEALLDGVEDAEAEAMAAPPSDDEKFTAAVSDAITFTGDFWQKQLKEQEQHIETIRKTLHDAYGILKERQVRLKSCTEKSFYTDTLERLPKDRKRILAMPEVKHLTVVNDGVHVYLKPLAMVWQGKTYPLGSFAIRIGKYGHNSIWGVESTHPDGVPHPHIAKDGGPCYGNATDAITKAAAEFRVADTVNYLIKWLIQGYTPELAEHKIEEWAPAPEGSTECNSTSRINGRSSNRNQPAP